MAYINGKKVIQVNNAVYMGENINLDVEIGGTDTSTNILAFNEDKGIYVGTDTGDWYYWDGTQYVDGGVYQTAVNYDALEEDLNYILKNSLNVLNTSTITSGKALTTTGSQSTVSVAFISDYIPVEQGDLIYFNDSLLSSSYCHCFYKQDKTFLSSIYSNDNNRKMDVPVNAYYVRVTGQLANLNNDFVISNKAYKYKLLPKYDETNCIVKANNLLDTSRVLINKAIQGGRVVNTTEYSLYVTDYIPVTPNRKIYISQGLKSSTFQYQFYGNGKEIISTGYLSLLGYMEINVPSGAYYFRTTGLQSNLSNDYIYANLDLINRPSDYRKIFDDITGYSYKAFSSGIMFNKKQIFATRIAPAHLTDIDPANYGEIIFDMCDFNDLWTSKILDTTGYNFLGELRDPHLSYINDNCILLSCFSTRYDENDNPLYSTVIFTLDKNLEITSMYNVETSNYLAWGNILVTPDGYLIRSEYSKNIDGIRIVKSNEIFTGDLSSITFSTIKEVNYAYANECNLCYSNDKLVCIFRVEHSNSRIMTTTDLEGETLWSEHSDLGMALHSPCMFAKYNTNQIFITASYEQSEDYTNRVPVECIVDVDNGNVLEYCNVDDLFVGWGGYPAMCDLGGGNIGIVYFLHNGSYTTFYYRETNLYYDFPKNYFSY